MPDIFGHEALGYSHMRDMHALAPEVLEAYLTQQAQASRGRRHDFNALNGEQRVNMAEAEPIGYMTDNLQTVQAFVEEVLYTDYRLDEFLPIITNVPEGAVTYSYRVLDRVGRGRFIDNDGSMAPSANASLTNIPYSLEYAGIVPEWTREDIRRAMHGGVALDTETVRAATTGAMDHIEQVGLEGDSARGLKGLVKLPITGAGRIAHETLAAELSTLDGDGVVAELQKQVTKLITDTSEVLGRSIRSGLCIYLPLEQADLVLNKRLTDIDKTAWEYFQVHNLWYAYTGELPQLKMVAELDGAGSTSGNNRMIVALKNERVMEMAMPISPRVIGMYDKGYTVCAPMEYKVSGLNVKRPEGIRYVDGV